VHSSDTIRLVGTECRTKSAPYRPTIQDSLRFGSGNVQQSRKFRSSILSYLKKNVLRGVYNLFQSGYCIPDTSATQNGVS
jgi:hypothetical protein